MVDSEEAVVAALVDHHSFAAVVAAAVLVGVLLHANPAAFCLVQRTVDHHRPSFAVDLRSCAAAAADAVDVLIVEGRCSQDVCGRRKD